MNKEIKEILEQLKIRNDLYNDRDENCIIPIEYYETHILLDYITNLEQEKQMLEKIIIKQDEEQRKLFNHIVKDDYKSRIDKAIKYLVSHCVISDEWTEVNPLEFVPTGHISYKSCGKKHTENLLNILTGGDEE